jgi:hypothetical protein
MDRGLVHVVVTVHDYECTFIPSEECELCLEWTGTRFIVLDECQTVAAPASSWGWIKASYR